MAKNALRPKAMRRASVPPLPRWQMIENVVAACERIKNRLPGTVVTQKAQLPVLADPNDHREVDVLIRIPSGGRQLEVGVEVKERGTRKLHTTEIGALIDLKNEVGLHYLCVVCTRGFTKPAIRKAKRHGIQLAVPEQIKDTGFFPSAGKPLVFEESVAIEQVDFIPPPNFSPTEAAELERAEAGLVGDDFLVVDSSGNEIALMHVLKVYCLRAAKQSNPPPTNGELLSVTLNGFAAASCTIRCKGDIVHLVDGFQVLARFIQRPIPHETFRILGLEVATFDGEISGETRQITMGALPVEGQPGGFRVALTDGPTNPARTRL